MRVVIYDGIQESHVAASLERALIEAGHQVYNTRRFGAGYLFPDLEGLLPVIAPHLERIADFRPDLVLVFRPSSAPFPVLQALRGTGAVLAAWLSDDPVLFDLSYGPALELYDLVLHCGNAEVLRFYERQFGRPTGVNFPFWTDHEAFPAVHGRHEPDTTVLFLGNVVGPLRRRRYEQLASMRHEVTVYGRTGDDPAGLGGGFLDTDAEVVQAGSRARVALNIPQFFTDHRDQPTWFPGLDGLGFFDLPSRVIQYAAMGLPTVTVIPGAPAIPSFPELTVCGSIEEADEWIGTVLDSGRLAELSARTLDRFDRSFSARSRVLALESLMVDDSWRTLDPVERELWFHRFDGRTPAPTGPTETDARERVEVTLDRPEPAPGDVTREVTRDVAVVHGREPRRFGATDVILRELRDWGRDAMVWGPGSAVVREVVREPGGVGHDRTVDVHQVVQAFQGTAVRLLVLTDGIGLTPADAGILRQAGLATVRVLGPERLSATEAGQYDAVARVGPAPAADAAVLEGIGHCLRVPGLVESAFLAAVRHRGAGPAATGATSVHAGQDPWAAGVLAELPGPHENVTFDELDTAGLQRLAELFSRPVVCLQPVHYGRRQAHPPLTPYALCAASTVLTTRHRRSPDPDPYSPWITRADTVREAGLKLARRGPAPGPAAVAGGALELTQHSFDARAHLATWFDHALAGRDRDHTVAEDVIDPGTEQRIRLGRRYRVQAEEMITTAQGHLSLTLRFQDPGLLCGLRLYDGDRTVAQTHFPPGSAGAVEVIAWGQRRDPTGDISVEFMPPEQHRLGQLAGIVVRSSATSGQGVPGTVPDRGFTAYLLPVATEQAGDREQSEE